MLNFSDFFRTIIIILIVVILGRLFLISLPYIIMAGIAVWITLKIIGLFKKKNVKKDEIKVEPMEDTIDDMKKDAIDVDYEEINKK